MDETKILGEEQVSESNIATARFFSSLVAGEIDLEEYYEGAGEILEELLSNCAAVVTNIAEFRRSLIKVGEEYDVICLEQSIQGLSEHENAHATAALRWAQSKGIELEVGYGINIIRCDTYDFLYMGAFIYFPNVIQLVTKREDYIDLMRTATKISDPSRDDRMMWLE